ncbi:hypothetical protein HMPREF9536_02196, partial [Escherichia coli MS 84-1]
FFFFIKKKKTPAPDRREERQLKLYSVAFRSMTYLANHARCDAVASYRAYK